MSVLHPRKIAAQQASTFLDVALRHSFLQTVISNGLADVHDEASDWTLGMLNSNQSSTVWQVEIRAMRKNFRVIALARMGDIRSRTQLHLERAGKEINRTLPCIRRVFGAVASFVVGILEGMARIRVDDDLNLLTFDFE